MGYEGLLVDGFLDLLIRKGIRRVLDVRRNPVARRYGFHKSTLKRLCGYVQVAYEHFPELGIPSRLRRDLRSPEDYEAIFGQYERDTLRTEGAALGRVATLIVDKPSVLMCMEADPSRCHRTRLAKTMSLKIGLPVLDLWDQNEAGV